MMKRREEEYSRRQEERQHKRRREDWRRQEERQHKRRRTEEYPRRHQHQRQHQRLQSSSQISHLLPEHLLFEHILPRLPVKSLLRFMSVSKSWNAEISHPRFVRLQLRRATTTDDKEPDRFLAISQERNRDGDLEARFHTLTVRHGGNVSLRPLFKPKAPLRRESNPSCCNGLVLMSTYVVVNPSTREEFNLPEGGGHKLHHFPSQSCMGYVSTTDEYIVVHLFRRSSGGGGGGNIGVGLFTLGRDHSWRSTPVDPPYPISTSHGSVHIDGWVYWLIDNSNSAPPNSILGLNLSNEEFVVIPPPPCRPNPPQPYRVWLLGLDSRLCLCEFQCTDRDRESSIDDGRDVPIAVDIWTTKTRTRHGGEGYQWNKYYSSDNVSGVKGFGFFPLAVHRDKKLLVNTTEAIQYLDPRANKLEEPLVQLKLIRDRVKGRYIPYQVVPHVESLVSPNAAPATLLPYLV